MLLSTESRWIKHTSINIFISILFEYKKQPNQGNKLNQIKKQSNKTYKNKQNK